MKKSILALLLLFILAACAAGNSAANPQSADQVATIVAGTLSALPTEAPAVVPTQAPATAKLEDFPNKAFVGENERFSVFTINPTGTDPERIGPIIIYNKGMDAVNEIVGTFTLLNTTIVANDDLGKYVLLSTGTYTSHKAVVISLEEKKQAVNEFCVQTEGYLFWNDYVIYDNCERMSNRPWGAGEAPGITAVNLKTGALIEVAKSDLLRQFGVKSIAGNTLQYVETSVNSEADWANLGSHIKTERTYDLSALGK